MSGSPDLPFAPPPPSIDESISSDEHLCKRPGSPGTDTSQVKRPKTDDESSNPQMDEDSDPNMDDESPDSPVRRLTKEEQEDHYDRLLRQFTEDTSEWESEITSFCPHCTFTPGDVCKHCHLVSPPENWGWPYGMSCHACGALDHFTQWCKDKKKLARFWERLEEAHKLVDHSVKFVTEVVDLN